MKIGIISTPYSDYQICTVVDGFLELGHEVYDLSGRGLNYMKPITQEIVDELDFFIAADTDNHEAMQIKFSKPKVILHGHDRWTDYLRVPDSPLKPIRYDLWNGDIAFVRDWDHSKQANFPTYPMEFSIERRFRQACERASDVASNREFVVSFFGTLSTAGRNRVMDELAKHFKCNFGGQSTFTKPDDYWSRWVNGRYVHAPKYYEALCNSTFALSPLGAGPSCGRTYEAYAAGCIPLIQRYPEEIQQIVPFVDGENCILWETTDELVNKIKVLLYKPVELDNFQRQCYEFGQTHLLSKHRAQYMLGRMKEHNLIL